MYNEIGNQFFRKYKKYHLNIRIKKKQPRQTNPKKPHNLSHLRNSPWYSIQLKNIIHDTFSLSTLHLELMEQIISTIY